MHTLRRLRFAFIARFIAMAAVLCLLGVQQAAPFHGLSHFADDSSPSSQKHLPHAKSCDKCLVYAEVSGAGPTTGHEALFVPAPFQSFEPAAQRPFSSLTFPVYSARAPPFSA